MLMKDKVTEIDIQQSKNLLRKWFETRNNIFPHNPYTLKTHEMTHFPDQVRIHGPLQSSSCFAGENILNKISKMVTANQGDVILKQIAERFSQESSVAEWKTRQSRGPLHRLVSILDDNSHKNDQLLPSSSILAQGTGSTQCTKRAKISDYEFASSLLVENETDSFCIFKHQNSYKVGCIEYIAEAGDDFHIQIQSYEAELVNNIQEFVFHDYYILGERWLNLYFCESKDVLRKGIVIKYNVKKNVCTIIPCFEHN
uniref:Uncharacterized protein n=1 Tax=Panagrolaimus superbus TaxID=310955 RepID=A0A914YXP7_9BILA